MRRALLVLCLLISGLAACTRFTLEVRGQNAAPPIVIVYTKPLEQDARLVHDALLAAGPQLGAFGPLRQPTTITLQPDQATIGARAGLVNSPWLRAWATYSDIELQTPSSWQGPARREHLLTLLVHELTHLAMYQRAGNRADWHRKPLPFWFREGLACYVAGLGDNRFSRERLQAFYLSPDYPGDPILEGESLVLSHPREVYAASYYFMQALVERFGRACIGDVLDHIRAGEGFLEAWQNGTGTPFAAVLAEWRGALLAQPR